MSLNVSTANAFHKQGTIWFCLKHSTIPFTWVTPKYLSSAPDTLWNFNLELLNFNWPSRNVSQKKNRFLTNYAFPTFPSIVFPFTQNWVFILQSLVPNMVHFLFSLNTQFVSKTYGFVHNITYVLYMHFCSISNCHSTGPYYPKPGPFNCHFHPSTGHFWKSAIIGDF